MKLNINYSNTYNKPNKDITAPYQIQYPAFASYSSLIRCYPDSHLNNPPIRMMAHLDVPYYKGSTRLATQSLAYTPGDHPYDTYGSTTTLFMLSSMPSSITATTGAGMDGAFNSCTVSVNVSFS